ncbi:MAG: primosomal protein N' [Gammaproteobacteria bacterium]|jgi:primosomal protein N' (replication factor Y)|nr:primosomal protein N' [Gammaproteobacteria bacterium]
MKYKQYATIYVENLPHLLTYGVPDDLSIEEGDYVSAPIQSRHQFGIVVHISSHTELSPQKIKPLLNNEQSIAKTDKVVELSILLGQYYNQEWYQIMLQFYQHMATPGPKTEFLILAKDHPIQALTPVQKKLLTYCKQHQPCSIASLFENGFNEKTIQILIEKQCLIASAKSRPNLQLVQLNKHQQAFIDQFSLQSFHTQLLWGATGSGKTECFSHLIATFSELEQALILVPEIGLVAPTAQKIAMRLNEEVLTYHSAMSEKEKNQVRNHLNIGTHRVVVATRSGIFLRLPYLKLIIIDEEHDSSYQQQTKWLYHARDVAIWRAKTLNIPILLASATPSLSSYHNVQNQKFSVFRIRQKALATHDPIIHLTDLSKEKVIKGFATSTIEAIYTTLKNNQHVMVFINRRGYARRYQCSSCAWISLCPNCSSSLVYHQKPFGLQCHHCAYRDLPPSSCPECHSTELEAIGYGTQQIESFLDEQFQCPILRFDQDHTQPDVIDEHIQKLGDHAPSIIVGTQMISKGYDFRRIGLVIFHQADLSLYAHDPFSPEKFIQLFFQVLGRSARFENEKSTIVIQTRKIENNWISGLKKHDIDTLYEHLLHDRNTAKLPPFTFQAKITAKAKDEQKALQYLLNWKKHPNPFCTWVGPAPCVLQKKSGYYQFQCHITALSRKALIQAISIIKHHTPRKNHHSLLTQIALDPQES